MVLIPNVILDNLSDFSEPELRILLYIVRWQPVPIDQITRFMGCFGFESEIVTKTVTRMADVGYIQRSGDAFVWQGVTR